MIYIVIFIIAWIFLGKISLYIAGIALVISLFIVVKFMHKINPRRTGHNQEDNIGS
jgi:hypothetical protein